MKEPRTKSHPPAEPTSNPWGGGRERSEPPDSGVHRLARLRPASSPPEPITAAGALGAVSEFSRQAAADPARASGWYTGSTPPGEGADQPLADPRGRSVAPEDLGAHFLGAAVQDFRRTDSSSTASAIAEHRWLMELVRELEAQHSALAHGTDP